MTERIHGGVEILEQEEGGDDDEDQEESVVVEDGEGGGLVVSDLILFPQDPERKEENSMSISFINVYHHYTEYVLGHWSTENFFFFFGPIAFDAIHRTDVSFGGHFAAVIPVGVE